MAGTSSEGLPLDLSLAYHRRVELCSQAKASEIFSGESSACDFYHFTGNVDGNGLRFDYLLKPSTAHHIEQKVKLSTRPSPQSPK
jgi:hypothetical protein